MTCREFENLLLEGAESPEGAAHAADCPACATQLETRRKLASALQLLAREIAAAAPSPAVEANLLRAFRAASRRRPLIGLRWRWGAVAAAAAVAVGVIWMRAPQSAIAPPPMPAPPAAAVLPPAARTPVASATASAIRPRRPARPRTIRREEAEFVPIPYTARFGPEDSLDVVRVRMPRFTMARFGMPVSPERALDPISADIAFGQDGIPRAIRLVK